MFCDPSSKIFSMTRPDLTRPCRDPTRPDPRSSSIFVARPDPSRSLEAYWKPRGLLGNPRNSGKSRIPGFRALPLDKVPPIYCVFFSKVQNTVLFTFGSTLGILLLIGYLILKTLVQNAYPLEKLKWRARTLISAMRTTKIQAAW